MTCRVKLSKSIVLDLHSPDIVGDGFRCWISGESGSGKSSAAALIVAQVIEQGSQVVALDVHGEYGDLWALGPTRVTRIGYGGQPVSLDSVPWCMDVLANNKSLLLDLSHWNSTDPESLDTFMLEFMRGLFALRQQRPKWTMVLVEEAQNIIPQQQGPGQAKNVRTFLKMITEGRKYGLQFILTSQRLALVDINAIAGCNLRLFLRVSEFKDWKIIKKYLPPMLKVDFNETRYGIKNFPSGAAVLLCRWTSDARIQLLPPTHPPRKPLVEL